jgi:hypothetical protein
MTQSGMRYEGQQGFGGQGVSRSLLQPSSVPSTPIEGYKFTSPSPSGAKLTNQSSREMRVLVNLRPNLHRVVRRELLRVKASTVILVSMIKKNDMNYLMYKLATESLYYVN